MFLWLSTHPKSQVSVDHPARDEHPKMKPIQEITNILVCVKMGIVHGDHGVHQQFLGKLGGSPSSLGVL
jgi:hypothetical protein